VYSCIKVKDSRPKQNQSFSNKEENNMTKQELENKVEEIRKYKAMVEEASKIQKALEQEVISYMNDNNLTEEYTDSAKITYTIQTRTVLDKALLKDALGNLDEYEKKTSYNVLRIK
jgi:hypothetical protein